MPTGDHTPPLAQNPAQARRTPGQGVGALLDEKTPKTVYKPGWARPKIKASPHKPPKPGAKKAVFKAKPGPAVISRDKPGAVKPASGKPVVGKPGAGKPVASKPMAGKPGFSRGAVSAPGRPERAGPPKSRKGR
jgi:23S rRNA pseudouridine2605 synthase